MVIWSYFYSGLVKPYWNSKKTSSANFREMGLSLDANASMSVQPKQPFETDIDHKRSSNIRKPQVIQSRLMTVVVVKIFNSQDKPL